MCSNVRPAGSDTPGEAGKSGELPLSHMARVTIGCVRFVLAGTGIVALIARFLYGQTFRTFQSIDFFGYLTVQSNMAAVVVATLAGIVALRGRTESRALSTARAVVTSLLLVAGIVFALMVLQAPAAGYRIDVPWSDQILHFVLPAATLADWVLSPGRQRVRWRSLGITLGYPVVWGVATLIRGSIVGWYPYFFLDPAQAGYPTPFILFSAAALGLFAAVQACLVGIGRLRSPLASGP